VPTVIAKVAVFHADERRRNQVIRRRKPPAAFGVKERMVAGMVVVVADGGVEHHAPEKLQAIGVGLRRPVAQLVGKQEIGPALAIEGVVVAFQHGERAHASETQMASISISTVKAFQHEHVLSLYGLQSCIADVDAAAACQVEGACSRAAA
jgi:hypothetical protein